MFTGIVQTTGRVRSLRAQAQDRDFVVECDRELVARLSLGASVALDGVCQTVTQLDQDSFTVHAIEETLRVTTLGSMTEGARLNLESALGAGDPLGGHFVSGHVDGTARIGSTRRAGESIVYSFLAEPELVGQLVPKGSVTIDGISLTVGPDPGVSNFEVHLIPHTLEVTTLGQKGAGDLVNLETDILGKYVLRFLSGATTRSNLDLDALHQAGFGTGLPGGNG